MKETQQAFVNINRATIAELTTLQGIGPGLAKRIIENRPYEKIDDLIRVPGIKEAKLQELKPFIRLEEKKTKPAPLATELGETETFVFLEDRNERQDALLIILGGFILGLMIIMLRRSNR